MTAVRAVIACLTFAAASPAASLRLVDWNVANHPNNTADQQQMSTVLNYAGGKIDLLAMAETDTGSAPDTATVFDSVYGSPYASVVAPADGGGDRTGIVYNTLKLTLVGTSTIGGDGTLTHPALRAQFRPGGTNGDSDFYVYSVHLMSGTATANKNKRVAEAAAIRNDVITLGSAANVIVAGDFNWQKADDVSAGVGAYRTFAATGNGRVTDPLNMVGDWRGNAAYQALFTEDPDTNLDDRFDLQLTSPTLLDGGRTDYVPGSYKVIGNNGTVAPGGKITAGPGLPTDVVTALGEFSDHLPVQADYSFLPSTLDGDADLDGGVSINDFNALASNFGKLNKRWADGDFDYDGGVSIIDFNLLAGNFGKSVGVMGGAVDYSGLLAFAAAHNDLAAFEAATGVPEPGVVIPLLSGLVLLRRSRAAAGQKAAYRPLNH